MRRILGFLFFAVLVVLGLFFGQRNGQPVTVDLYWIVFNVPLSVAVVGSVVVGVLVGSLGVFLGVVVRQKMRIRQLTRQLSRMPAEPPEDAANGPATPQPNV